MVRFVCASGYVDVTAVSRMVQRVCVRTWPLKWPRRRSGAVEQLETRSKRQFRTRFRKGIRNRFPRRLQRLLRVARSKPRATNDSLPLPVLRERAGVRVISSASDTGIPNHPHPNPLPEYRERGQEETRALAARRGIAATRGGVRSGGVFRGFGAVRQGASTDALPFGEAAKRCCTARL